MFLVLLLLVATVGAVESPYVILDPVQDVLRVSDMAKTMWMGLKAGGVEPVVSRWDSEDISLTLADVTCESPQDSSRVTCHLPASGTLTASTTIQSNGSRVFIASDTYSVSIMADLENATWGHDFVWSGPGTLHLIVQEKSPEEREERVFRGLVCFLVAVPVTALAEMIFRFITRSSTASTLARL